MPECWAATDDYGDALPEFAIARLGTTRWRSNLKYGSEFSRLAFAPDGDTVAASGYYGLTLFDRKMGKPVSWFAPAPNLKAAAFSPDGRTLITLGVPIGSEDHPVDDREKRLIQHWEVGTGRRLRQFEVDCPRVFSRSFPFVSIDGRFCVDAGGRLGKGLEAVIVWEARSVRRRSCARCSRNGPTI
jgi:hypothetical protein